MKKFLLIIVGCLLVFSMGCSTDDEADSMETATVEEVATEEIADETAVDGTEEGTEEVVAVAEYRKITAEEAKDMMVEGNLIVDVRTQEEYDSGHIEGAMVLPLDQLMAEEFTLLPNKDQVILVYCRSGNRSRSGAQILVDAGYTQVYDFGGIIYWPDDVVTE